jgi:hypothetical protein
MALSLSVVGIRLKMITYPLPPKQARPNGGEPLGKPVDSSRAGREQFLPVYEEARREYLGESLAREMWSP